MKDYQDQRDRENFKEEIIQEEYDSFWSLLLSEAIDALDEDPDKRFESALYNTLI